MTDSDNLFEQNLRFFKKINPPLAQQFENHKPLSTLVFDEDGEPDILFQGMKLYGTGAKKHADAQHAKFWKKPGVITLTPGSVSETDSEAKKLYDDLHDFAKANAITFNNDRTTRNAFHLFVLGVGLAQHIEPLINEVKPRNLVLIEPNPEFLYQSLFTFDWEGVLSPLIEEGVNIQVMVDDKPSQLIIAIRSVYTQFGRSSFDGLTVYRHYENPAFDAVEKFFAKEGDKLFSGMGYFEDEINMIANTYNNLKGGEERIFYADLEPKDFPIFVVGSGPSLDGAMDAIKSNAHKAVIVSCGTGLLPLLRAGVQPDFHVELERAKYQVEIPLAVADEYDLSDICLVGSTTLVPDIRKVFKKRVFYFRHMLSSFPAFSGELRNCLRFPSPTVGNTGTSFAQDTGFRQIYFMGMDLGFADPDAHHSSSSIYKTDLINKKKYDLGKVGWDRITRGNFGGEIKSTHVLQWCRDTIEVSIKNSSMGHIYYNCSDGSLIEGAVPLLPEFVDLPEPTVSKAEFVNKIIQSYPVYTHNEFDAHWKQGQYIQDVRDLGGQLIGFIRDNPNLETKKYISKIMKVTNPLSCDSAASNTLRGSVYLFLVVGEFFLDRIEQPDKKAALAAFLCDAICQGIESMCDEIDVEISSLEQTGKLVNRETIWD